MKTTLAITKGILIGAALIAIASLSSCGLNKAFPVGPSPLDEPGERQPTASELHDGNVRAITGNPTF